MPRQEHPMELVKWYDADRDIKNQAARLAMSLIVAGKKNSDILSSVESQCGIAMTASNINTLRKRDDVKAAIACNDTEALQTGIATKARRIAILEEGIELLHDTFVYTDEYGKRRLKTFGDGVQGKDAVAAVKTMADIVKVASEIMEPKQSSVGNVQVNVNSNNRVATFGEMIGIGGDTDILQMLKNAAAAIEEKQLEESAGSDDVIDVDFEVNDGE